MPVTLMSPVSRTVLTVVTLMTLGGCGTSFKSEDIFSTEQRDNASFSVKITAYRERRSFGQVLGGAYYVFEAKRSDEPNWKRFLVVAYDDPEPIDKKSIKLIDEKAGYTFMHRTFSVTTDAGKSWSLWDVSKIEALKDDRSCWIDQVTISENGNGTMEVKCNKSSRNLSTKDFGVTWTDNNEPGPKMNFTMMPEEEPVKYSAMTGEVGST